MPEGGDRRWAQTLPVEQWTAGAGAATQTPPGGAGGDAPVEPRMRGLALTERLREHGYTADEPAGERFRVLSVLGDGATARVYEVRDRNLGRDVAVKVLRSGERPDPADVARFVDEARTNAALDHPNVLPVHEIDVSDTGQVYFIMKKIAGRSLGDAIARSTTRARDPAIAANRLVSTMIGVGHALAYAHHRGVVHQDVKPDNIMLGSFGEVLLVDWGSATRSDAPQQRLIGTPLYMAPEQARRERVDGRADVYALGGTLLQALLLRPPVWRDTPEQFWRAKRAGAIDQPIAEERALAPAPLLDIALKALAADPADRYQRIEDLVADLERYQAGLAVSAHRDSARERIARWYRRHARTLWPAAAALTAIAALAALLYGERLKDMATWGAPIVAVDFADGSWRGDWKITDGSFEVRDGALVDTSALGSMLTLQRRLEGDAAIEFIGDVPAGVPAGDLSLFWNRDRPGGGPASVDEYHLQFGANGGAYTRIVDPRMRVVALDPTPQQAGRSYRVRAEIVDNRMSLYVDGRLRCSYADRVSPLTGGWFSIYTFYAGHRVRDVRIYQRGSPERVPATAAGDLAARIGSTAAADEEYRRIAAGRPGTALAAEADYKRGALAWRAGRTDDAFAVWEGVALEPWRTLVAMRRIDRWFATGEHDQVLAALPRLHAAADAGLRLDLAIQWAVEVTDLARRVEGGADPATLAAYLELGDRLFAGEAETAPATADGLIALGRYEQVLARFPFLPYQVLEAARALGHPERAAEAVRDPTVRALALLAMGEPDVVTAECPDSPDALDALLHQGRFDEAKRLNYNLEVRYYADGDVAAALAEPADSLWRTKSLIATGRGEESVGWADSCWGMMGIGRREEALRRYAGDRRVGMWPRHWAGLEAWIAGDRERAAGWFTVPDGWGYRQPFFAFAHAVMVPFLLESAGDRSAFAAVRADFAAHPYAHARWPWTMVRYVLGEIGDAEFLALPDRWFAEADLLLCRAVRHERAGEADAARADYRAWQALPTWRRAEDRDPVPERFVAWRLETLGAR